MRRDVDFSKLVSELMEAGITTGQMGRECDMVPSAIHALKSGRTREPAWSVGDYLIRKHFETFQVAP